MTAHTLYPGFMKLAYTANAHPHVAIIPVIPVLSGSDWLLTPAVGSNVPWHTGADDLTDVFFPLLNTADSVDTAELWTIATEGADPVFREAYAVAASGGNAGAATPNGMATYSFRTAGGGIYKPVILESAVATNVKLPYASLTGVYKTFADYFMSDLSVAYGRDRTRAIYLTRLIGKENDALRKKYFLSS